MNTITIIKGLYIIEPKVFNDERGSFMESFQQKRYLEVGIDETFLQDNLVVSKRNVFRGLHYQTVDRQGKLVMAISGSVIDIAVDLRPESETFGSYALVELSGENHRQFYISPGFAHGYFVNSAEATVSYKCSNFYNPANEKAVSPFDELIPFSFGTRDELIMSPKDREEVPLTTQFTAQELSKWNPQCLFDSRAESQK